MSFQKIRTHLILDVMKKSFTKVTPNCRDEIISKSESAILFVPDSLSEIFANAFPGRRIKIIQKPSEDWDRIKAELAGALNTECDRFIFFFTNPIDDRNLLLHISELTDKRRDIRKRIVILVHTTPKALPSSSLSQFQILGNFCNHPLAFEADKDFLNSVSEPREHNALTISIGEQQEIFNPRLYLMPADELKALDLFSTESEQQLLTIINNQREEITRQQADIETYKSRLDIIYKKVGKLLKCFGIIISFLGFSVIIFILRKIAPKLDIIRDDKGFSLLIRLFIVLFQESVRYGIVAIFGIILFLVGGALTFEIGTDTVYLYAKAKIENTLISQNQNPQHGHKGE
jgi:hypothetical protein